MMDGAPHGQMEGGLWTESEHDGGPRQPRDALFVAFDPCDRRDVRDLQQLLKRLRPEDHHEAMAMRATRRSPNELMVDLTTLAASEAHIDAALIYAVPPGPIVPPLRAVAYAAAYRIMPRMASLIFLASTEARRYMPAIARALEARAASFGAHHDLTCAEAKVWTELRSTIRWLERTGARPFARLNGIGRDGEDFVQMVWEFA